MWLPQTSLIWGLPIRQEILNVSQISIAGPWNLPTTFHLDPIATIQQRCLPLLCALLFQQSHLFPICVVSTYNDSMKDLHKLCQIPRNCQCKWPLGFLFGSKNFLQAPLGFLRSFVFARDDWIHWVAKSCTTTAYRWFFRDSQPSLRTLWSAVIKSPEFFCTRYGSANASSARGPYDVGPLAISQFRSFGKWV